MPCISRVSLNVFSLCLSLYFADEVEMDCVCMSSSSTSSEKARFPPATSASPLLSICYFFRSGVVSIVNHMAHRLATLTIQHIMVNIFLPKNYPRISSTFANSWGMTLKSSASMGKSEVSCGLNFGTRHEVAAGPDLRPRISTASW